MSQNLQLGRVDSLFPYVKPDWWKDAFNELYLRTDGDVVEDPAITEAECADLLSISGVANLFSGLSHSATSGDKSESHTNDATSPIRVLDLCCGQGRHIIALAKKFPSVKFYGLDLSSYLIDLAKKRADDASCHNTNFTVGDARQILDDDNVFDLVILMGNSFGVYADETDNARLLQEVSRVLKPGGTFVLDLVSAQYTTSSFTPGGWEWINGGTVGDPYTKATTATSNDRKLIACRERELSTDKKWLASRELVIDLATGVSQDLFYQLRLYGLKEMEALLKNCGLIMKTEDTKQLAGPVSEHNDDLGMMAARHLVVGEKENDPENSKEVGTAAMHFYVHPNLVVDNDPVKGRMIRSKALVKAGTLLIVDSPYAIAPDVQPESGDFPICSRLECSRRISDLKESVSCPNDCVPDVLWCNDDCRTKGQSLHEFECPWLKKNSKIIRQREHGDYDFPMLWLIVRILAHRHLEKKSNQHTTVGENLKEPTIDNVSKAFSYGWGEIGRLRSNREAIAKDKVQHYTVLAENYMGNDSLLPVDMDTLSIVDLICKEEMNAFCLYPKATGLIPPPGPPINRGRVYGLAFYTRGTLMNHDCSPNITHKPNGRGQMTFHASRDIEAGDECVIAYFDLAEHSDVLARRKFLEHWFTFVCLCKRCVQEAQAVN